MVDFPVKFGRRKLFVVEDPSDYFPVCVFHCGEEILPKQFLMISQTWRFKRRDKGVISPQGKSMYSKAIYIGAPLYVNIYIYIPYASCSLLLSWFWSGLNGYLNTF